MTEYIAQCLHANDDEIRAYRVGDHAFLSTYVGGRSASVALEADDARTFARGILALADEVDGGEAKPEPEEDTRPKVGDRVIVVEDDPNGLTGKFVGLVGTLTKDDGGPYVPYLVKFGDGSHGDVDGQWYCRRVEKVADETASPSAAAITFPTREEHLHHARELLGANPYSAHDLMRLADYLAGEGA
ncbi:hypothetical protein [Streptomyces cyaneofuscatus]|uniref:hypothetical protein n=1 Tax=Streptomyces cyaneofuscatus TaxID=66883 RepID=UPI00341926B3